MEAPSDTPPSSMDEKASNQVPQGVQQTIDNRQDSEVVDTKQGSPTSVFVNSEPIREEQVQNAVKFLSHPKVSGSPVTYRRSFLERKGLTKEEIDEAFRRVPDPTPAVTATQPLLTNQDGQLKPVQNVPNQHSAQVLQATPVAPVGRWLTRPSQFHWSHALLALGYLAVSGVGTAMLFKKAIIPRLKSWIRKIVLEEEDGVLKKPSMAEENALAAKAAAAAASDVARAIHEMLTTKSEEKEYFGELISVVNVQVNELRSMSNVILRLESGIKARNAVEEGDGQRIFGTNSKVFPRFLQQNNNGIGYTDPYPVRSLPPNANQRLAPRTKPLEYIPAQNSSTSILPTKLINNNRGDSTEVPWYKRTLTNDELKFKSSSLTNGEEKPAQQRSWVPPMPPPVSMPEAAAAIRQPKKPFQKEQNSDDPSQASASLDVSDELQRITKLSESGGDVEDSDEIQTDDNNSSLEA